MELWVRSQCGELLEKAEMVKVGTTDSGKTYSIIVNNDYVYADYKTKERALEVLDEIQEVLEQPQKHIEGDYTYYMPNDGSSKIYEMPKE